MSDPYGITADLELVNEILKNKLTKSQIKINSQKIFELNLKMAS
jgi:hypothetical protein